MTVKIENMVANPGNGVATFDAIFPDGWAIRRCVVVRRPDGNLSALPPLVRTGIRAVTIPEKHWFPFIKAALDAFDAFESRELDEGLRRVLGAAPTWQDGGTWSKPGATWADTSGKAAENESLALAGIDERN